MIQISSCPKSSHNCHEMCLQFLRVGFVANRTWAWSLCVNWSINRYGIKVACCGTVIPRKSPTNSEFTQNTNQYDMCDHGCRECCSKSENLLLSIEMRDTARVSPQEEFEHRFAWCMALAIYCLASSLSSPALYKATVNWLGRSPRLVKCIPILFMIRPSTSMVAYYHPYPLSCMLFPLSSWLPLLYLIQLIGRVCVRENVVEA